MGINWVQVEIDLALLLTAWLVVTSHLHWLAFKKTNDQTLFAMRIEHYKVFYKLCNDFVIKVEYYKPESTSYNTEVEALEVLILELDNYIDESKFLFDNALYELELEFVNCAKSIFEKFSANEAISADGLLNLQNSYKNSKNWIEKFLVKNKP